MFKILQSWILHKLGFKESASTIFFELASIAYENEDYLKTIKLLTKAAELDHPIAQYNLAVMYDNGLGVTRDPFAAFDWYRRSADQGYEDAEFCVGVAYSVGEVVPVDYAKSIDWYHKAAAQGQSDAQNNLGVMYDNGMGVPQDYKKSESWFCFAIQHNNQHAQFNLGKKYAKGIGVPKNIAVAYALFNLSQSEDMEAEQEMSKLERRMTSSDFTQAKKLINQIERRGINNSIIMRHRKA